MEALITRAPKMLKAKLDSFAQAEVEYRRQPHVLEHLKVIPGQTDFESYSSDDTITTAKSFDWVIAADDLRLDGSKVEPRTNDEIWYTLADGRRQVYRVLPDAGSRPFDVMDQLGILLRVHTKLDRIEPAL